MRHVVVIGSYGPSLVQFRGPLLAALVARGYRVTAMTGPAGGEVLEQLARLGVSFEELEIDRASIDPRHDARLLWHLARRLRALRADVVLSYTIKPVIYGTLAALFAGVPQRAAMITGVGYAFRPPGDLRHRVVGAAAKALLRGAVAFCQQVIFQNPDDQALFSELRLVGAAHHQAVVRGSGVDLAHFAPMPLPDGPTVFLFVGRLLVEKGVRELAAAARRLRELHPTARVQLVGWLDANPTSIRAEELAAWRRDGVVEYLGELSDVRTALAGAHVLVLPSVREGTPRSVLEAMACRRAIITTDAPGCRETIVHQESGLLVGVHDVDGLVAAMRRLVEEPGLVPRLAEAALSRARALYDAHKVAEDILRHLAL